MKAFHKFWFSIVKHYCEVSGTQKLEQSLVIKAKGNASEER
jgi:hypothetical protein